MRRLLTAGLASLTLALMPISPAHAAADAPRAAGPAGTMLAALLGIVLDPVRGDRHPAAASTLPRHGVGRIDRNAASRRPVRRSRPVNARRGRYRTAGGPALRRPAPSPDRRRPVSAAPPRPSERTVVQR